MELESRQTVSTSRKNMVIEYMRFLCSLIIVLWHMRNLNSLKNTSFFISSGGYIVEFFAILSGFLMAKSLSKYTNDNPIGNSFSFMKKKWSYIWLMHAIAFVFAFIVRQLPNPGSIGKVFHNFTSTLPELLLINTTGISIIDSSALYNGPAWYLSSMFLSMIFLVPAQQIMPKLFRYLCIPCGLICLGIVMRLNGNLRATGSTVSGVLILGNFRICGELLIGCGAWYIYSFLRKRTTVHGLAFYIIGKFAALVGWAFFLYLIFFGAKADQGGFIVIFNACLIIFSFFFFDQKAGKPSFLATLGEKLGSMSLALYLNHMYWMNFINSLRLKLGTAQQILIYLVLTIVSAFICQWFCNAIIRWLHREQGTDRNPEKTIVSAHDA